jgi:hypothetical protein
MTARLLPWFLLATVALASAATTGCHLLLTDLEVSEDGNGCPAGLRPEGDSCVCCAIVQNPDFDDDSHWEVTGAARIEGGAGKLPPDAACTGGSLRQRVSIPPASYTGPLMLAMTVRATNYYGGSLGMGIDGNWIDLGPVPVGEYQQRFACLGSGLASMQVDLEVAPYIVGYHCGGFNTGTIEIDYVDIVPSTEEDCPTSGFVPNGNFEDGNASWTGAWSVGVEGGEDGGLIASYAGAQGNVGHLENLIRIPPLSDIPSPAIQVRHSMPHAVALSARLGDHTLGAWSGAAAWVQDRACIPPALAGTSTVLRFDVGFGQWSFFNDAFTALLDDVMVVSDSRCDWSAGTIGGDFEPLGPPPLARTFTSQIGWEGHHSATPTVHEDWSIAEITVGECVLTYYDPEGGWEQYEQMYYSGFRGIGRVPAPGATGGPALSFQYRQTGATSSAHLYVPGGHEELQGADYWQQHVTCLPAGFAGRMAWFTIDMYYNDAAYCDDPSLVVAAELQLDDVEFIIDPGCD